ncbi:ArpU family phage packaging/lysis transcriptional regulator [Lactobacillus delbrueckii]|uniref:ArpU family phage packaging/lysis transcriptional regulator n=1 Tax=Lactobacillus delbrueckii TaxID=1584 RepID=UPI003A84115E
MDNLELDQRLTARKVDQYLKHDFERYLRESGAHRTDISSPSMSGMPGGTIANQQEDKLLEGLYAASVVDCIKRTIANCSDGDIRKPYKIILVDYYLKGMQGFKIAQKIGYSDRQFANKKRLALCEFADRFEYWKLVFKVQDQPCLQVPKNAQSMHATCTAKEIL